MTLVVGMNSGSSFDGIDVTLIEVDFADDGVPARPRFVDGLAYAWPEPVRKSVLAGYRNELPLWGLSRLQYVIGAVYAEAAAALLEQAGVDSKEIMAVGVDGQTIYQEPPDRAGVSALPADASIVDRWLDGPYGCGLFVVEGAVIAEHLGIPTITHFRAGDHVAGGTGAPLMQYLDFVSFRDIAPIITLNIGGIANCHLAAADRADMMGFDLGPGNVLMDYGARRLFNQPYDRDGQACARGKVDDALLAQLRSHPFFDLQPPRSTQRVDFGEAYADSLFESYSDLDPYDIMATFCECSARCIVDGIEQYVPDARSVPVLAASGGGVRNKTLMARIAELLPDTMRLTTTDEFGLPAQYKEAIKFGTLAFSMLHGLAGNVPACSGASHYAVLGKLSLPPRFARLHVVAGDRPAFA